MFQLVDDRLEVVANDYFIVFSPSSVLDDGLVWLIGLVWYQAGRDYL